MSIRITKERESPLVLCDKLEAHVPGNIRTHASITAKPFFQKRGYKVTKEQQVERQGILLTNFVMELEKKKGKALWKEKLMKKVIVIGSPGAGKSTFSRETQGCDRTAFILSGHDLA